MKILITESQYNLLIEQSDAVMDRRGNSSLYGAGIRNKQDYEKVDKVITQSLKSDADPHTVAMILGIGTAIIPVVGPFIAAGIGLADASLYYKEGDKTTAGIVGALSMIPFIGPIVNKIPGAKELGVKGMALLASKMSSGGKGLTKVELEVVNQIKNNSDLIKNNLKNASTKLTPLTQQIKSLKPLYIERFGQESYEKVLSHFLSGSIDKNKFISIISSGGKPVPKLANFVSKFGIKFSQQEIKNLNDIVSWINNLPTTLINPLLDKKTVVRVATKFGNKDISVRFVTSQTAVKMYDDTMKNTYGFAIGENKIYFIVDNIKKMSKTDMEQLFYHEFAHIKDPSKISSSLMKKYNSLVPRYSDEYFSKSYYFHPRELVANTSKILNGLSVNTQRFMKTIGKQNTLKALDDLISWSKGTKKDFTDNMTKLLGSNEKYVKEHLDNLLKSPEDLRKLKAKIGQQSEYLKSQVNLSL